ncbi:MAG TPA: phosphatase PAP2 family protein [Actinophytocola sp.]|uniref:phosphatase PAP2 family protein n=1 Tax=Actinophytocola sp. TaxID=1872138 RepID=UPI002DBD5F4D|nr:phosphatase PAP2 family protein [Actinophytocola sp.]HEU5471082.1 phosphatase PAP2 family protein [Actinophytocola sp.]
MTGLTRFAVIAGAGATVVLGLCWLALAEAIVDRSGTPTPADTAVLTFMIANRSTAGTAVMFVVTTLGGTLAMSVAALLAAAWLSRRRAWSQATLVLLAGIGAFVLLPLTKHLIDRSRPPPGAQLVLMTNPAFPSGHALGSLAVIGVITAVALARLRAGRTRIIVAATATMFVLLVGASRLYLGVHWATDILGGWLLAGTWLGLCLAGYALRRRPPS